ncbi:MAG TPA: PIG-L family deacetylase [Clostridiales bacterium]|nr:PIG-L family deacetylase [Clostridiales bacterium]
MKALIKKITAGPIKIVNRIVLGIYLNLVKKKAEGIQEMNLKNKRLLVISPHQDDEILGCGCLIKKALEQNCTVKCIYISDGSQSLSYVLSPEALAELRKVEAKELAKSMGMDEPVFMDCPDCNVDYNDMETAKKIAEVIESYKPDVILIPYFLDGHKDHTATSGIFIAAAKMLKNHKQFELYCYEINSPISVYGISHYVDCSGYFESKKEALKFYGSQIMSFESIFEMNKLNRIIAGTDEGAELFTKVDLDSYEMAYEKYNKNNQVYSCFRQMYSIYFMILAYFRGLTIKKEVAVFQNIGVASVGRKDSSGKGIALN